MSVIDSILGKKSKEPEFIDVKFKLYRDFYDNFTIEYPEDWKYDPSVIMDAGGYAVVFHSNKSYAHFRLGVETVMPLDLKEYAVKEIEDPSAGVFSKACKTKFRKYRCFETDYIYEHDGNEYVGEKKIFQSEDKVFSIFYTYPEKEREKLKKVFNYMSKSLVIKPSKTKIFKGSVG